MKRPDESWIADWRVGVAPADEQYASRELIKIFGAFWESEALDTMSKSTQNRYAGGLQALGGYLIEKVADPETRQPVAELLLEAVGGGEGPLIHWDNESWQRELDTVARKLERFLRRQERLGHA